MIKKSKIALLLGFTLFAVTLGLYWQTRTFSFIDYDDIKYIHKSGAVTNGLCIDSITWAFGPEQCRQVSNWHPITTLSWMLDVSLFGVNAGAMHLHNAFVHSVNGVLLFLFLLMLMRCMGQTGRATVSDRAAACSESIALPRDDRACAGHGRATVSDRAEACSESIALPENAARSENVALPLYIAAFIGAAFWAWHPLRAESVAWVSSRKDVLSILFLLPGLMAYLKALRGGGKVWLFVSGVCYLFAYFSKPTAVVYPLLAAMLEYVVTRRISWRQNELLVYLMVILMAATFIVQDVGGATVMTLPLRLRLENSIAGLGHYVSATVWPTHLSIFYKYEVPVSFTRFLTGSVFLIVVFWFLLDVILPRIKRYWHARHEPISAGGYAIEPVMLIAFGLLWFGFALAPVIGLIQVGFASCADRYTYLSGLGVSVILVVLAHYFQDRIARFKTRKSRSLLLILFGSLFAGVLVLLTVLATHYITQWKNTQTVFDHAARVTEGNYVAYCNAGGEPLNDGRYGEAFERFFESSKYMFAELERKRLSTPYKNMIATNLAIAFSGTEGDWVERTALGAKMTNNVVLSTKVKIDDPLAVKKIFAQGLYSYWKELDSLAIQYFDEAIKLAPLDDYLWRFKGYSLERMGLKQEALVAFKRSFSLKPAKDIQQRIKALEQAIAAGN